MNESIFTQNRDLFSRLIADNSEIGIVIGEPNDLDKLASGLALYLGLGEIGKNVQIASRTQPIVEFSNLVGIDRVKRDFSGSVRTFTISLPYSEGEIEKVSYKIDNDKLNINLFAGERSISFSEKDIKYIRSGSVPSLIISIGVTVPETLAAFFDLSSNTKIVNIDNNSENSGYGDIAYVGPSYSSISEMVTKIIHDLSIGLNNDIAQNLMDGITSATDNFSSYSTSPYAFEATSFLLRNGAKRQHMLKSKLDSTRNFLRDVNTQKITVPDPVYQPVQNNNVNQEANIDEVPEDWFTPKVFKSSLKKQDGQS